MIACADCGLLMKTCKTGATVLLRDGSDRPYQVWSADAYTCLDCDSTVLVNMSSSPMAVRGEAIFNEMAEDPDYTVDP